MNTLATWAMLLAIIVTVLWLLHELARPLDEAEEQERITQERHDANARTLAHIEAVRRG